MNTKVIGAIVVLILLLVGGFLLLRGNNQSKQSNTSSAGDSSNSTQTPQADSSSSSEEIMVMGSSFKFEPSQINAKVGETVKIRFMNTSGTHNLTIDGLNVTTKTLASGQEEVVEFTPDRAGTFQFYCSVGSHREQGMVGTLTVTN